MGFEKGNNANPAGNIAWKKGVSANPAGRPKNPEIQYLRDALAAVKAEKNIGLLESVVRRAYKSDTLAVAVLRKLIPDMTHVEAEVTGDINITLVDSYGTGVKSDDLKALVLAHTNHTTEPNEEGKDNYGTTPEIDPNAHEGGTEALKDDNPTCHGEDI